MQTNNLSPRNPPARFNNEVHMSAIEKERILEDWQRFWRSGFDMGEFSDELYQHLILRAGFSAHYDRRQFWIDYFGTDMNSFALFINQFAGNLTAAETEWVNWLDGPGSDLNQALCAAARPFYDPLHDLIVNTALTQYERERWQAANAAATNAASHTLAQNHTAAEVRSMMGLAYEMVFPFETYLPHVLITHDFRQRVFTTINDLFDAIARPTIFDVAPLTAQAPTARVVPSLFEHRTTTAGQHENLAGNAGLDAIINRLSTVAASLPDRQHPGLYHEEEAGKVLALNGHHQ